MTLTPAQRRAYDFVVDYRARHKMSPTMQEIATDIGVSKVTVLQHVRELVRKNAVTMEAYRSRSIKPVESGWEDVVKRLEKVVGEADMLWNVRLELRSILSDAKKLLEGK